MIMDQGGIVNPSRKNDRRVAQIVLAEPGWSCTKDWGEGWVDMERTFSTSEEYKSLGKDANSLEWALAWKGVTRRAEVHR
jgi:hypothetical protein